MNGILHIIDQAGTAIAQLQQENEVLRERLAALEQSSEGPQ